MSNTNNDNHQEHQEHLALIRRIQNNLTQMFRAYSGKSTDGDEYDSIEEMWISEGVLLLDGNPTKGTDTTGGNNNNSSSSSSDGGWYTKSHDYWQNENEIIPATTDGMLGGFASLTERDLVESRRFVEEVLGFRSKGLKERLSMSLSGDNDGSKRRRRTRCCECGAGIGRVSKGLLLPLGFDTCDLIETSPRLIAAAPEYIGDPDASRCRYICTGLQNFEPALDTYDVVWIQWVIGYLTDFDLVRFLQRAAASLRQPDGLIFLKDNVCQDGGAFLVDNDDSSLARSLPYLLALVKEAGLRVVPKVNENGGGSGEMLRFQDDFPEDIFPVPMMALELDV